MKRVLYRIAVFFTWILAAASILFVAAFGMWAYIVRPVDSAENSRVEKINVPSGTSIRKISILLKEKGLVKSADAFYYSARFSIFDRTKPFNLKSGSYTLSTSMGLKEIYRILQSGVSEYVSVVIPEGLTMSKIARILEDKNICSAEDFLSCCKNPELLEKYKIPAQNFEGYLFPDTYFFITQMKAEDVVCIMADNFFSKTAEISGVQGLSPSELHDFVTLASVVEREYRVKSEAPLISSVFTNRLKHGIGLYSCATIEYILTEIQGKPHPERITYDDLKIDSPYNTYKWAGLPAGPISNPGLVALSSAFNPAKTDYYFFVLTDPATGRHTFSKNFNQHKAAENTNYYSKGF